jgi:hypothetical protein
MKSQQLIPVLRSAARIVALTSLITTSSLAQVDILRYDNGPFINRPGLGPGGTDGSVFQSDLGMGVFGWPSSQSEGLRVADDFSIPSGQTWALSMVRFFGYCFFATPSTSFTGLTLQIWNAQPGATGSQVIWGNTSDNIRSGSAFAGAYRYKDGSPDSARSIFSIDGSVNLTLGSGTYWLDWAFSDPTGVDIQLSAYQMPITIDGQTTTGNGLWMPIGGIYGAATDVGQQGFPFQLFSEIPEPSVATLALIFGWASIGARWLRKHSTDSREM